MVPSAVSPLALDTFALLRVHRLRIPAGLFGPSPLGDLEQLGWELRQEVGPQRWLGADPQARMELAAAAYARICRCLRLPISELAFEPQRPGPLARHDPLTGRVFVSMMLVIDRDPTGIVRALFQESWQRSRHQLARDRGWLRSSTRRRSRRLFLLLWGEARPGPDAGDRACLEAGPSLARVLAGFAGEAGRSL